MMRMKHYALIGACLMSIGSMGSAVDHWTVDAGIKFAFGAMAAIGFNITSMYTQRPNEKRRREVPPLHQ